MRRFIILGFLMLLSSGLSAQGEACPADIDLSLSQIETYCEGIGRNEVCYANIQVDAETRAGTFSEPGNIIEVADLLRMETAPLNPDSGEWGIALFSIQANIENSLPGQVVTMIVFGNTELRPDTEQDDYAEPMQAFFFSTGIGRSMCDSVPNDGIIIQNSTNQMVNLLINGFEIEVASTALFTAEDEQSLEISTLEGLVTVTVDGEAQSIPEGFSLSITRDETPETAAPAPELEIPLSDLLPETLPEIREPDGGQVFGLLACANTGGIDVAAGSDIILRGGWAENALSDLLSFAATNPTSLSYDGASLSHSYRVGPSPWANDDGEGFLINWFWVIPTLTPGTHSAVWNIADASFTCEIRAS